MRFWFTRDDNVPGYVFWFGIDPGSGVYDVVAMDCEVPERALAAIERQNWDTLH